MSRIHVHELLLMGILTALLFIGQVFLAFLPNIEIVSFLIILSTLVFGRKVFLMIYTFILLEGILYGFGLWWFQYLYLWSILAATVLLLRRFNHFLFWSVISGFFGLAFGALCAIPYVFLSGPDAAFAYWIAGIPFDLLHCLGNLIVCCILFRPVYAILSKLSRQYHS